ncbi:MAG: hypothetical protein ABSD56_00590 [Bryobacteraceae bacterium]|jgi:hypothetical protein
MLASDLINEALTLLGVQRPGYTPSTADSAYALAILNTLLENWNVQGLHVFTLTEFTSALTPAKQSYKMGKLAEFNSPRPVRIESASILRASLRTALTVVDAATWGKILSPSMTDILPTLLYNDNSYDASGWTSLSFWPIPTDANSTVYLLVWAQLIDTLALGDTLSFPPGYAKALIFNLAVDLAPAFNRPLDPTVAQIAAGAKQELRAINLAVATETPARPPLPPAPQGPPPQQQQ